MSTASIVIPVRDRPGLTRTCLETILGQAECESVEVIVVDDGSGPATGELLAAFGDRLVLLRHETSRGFAAACNAGARAATGERLVFLNNDTRPRPGWLTALLSHHQSHPRAAVVGSRLLYPDGTVQHAGVVFCRDRWPRHLYAGLPGDHPAATRSRRLAAVSAACALVARDRFDEVRGFDERFSNGLEDVDLCLRLGGREAEVHLCGDSVVEHLEFASRAGRSRERAEGEALFRARWAELVEPDDLDCYLEDGLIELTYGETLPARLRVSPLLATLDDDDREREANWLLNLRSRQAYQYLRESVRLTAALAEAPRRGELANGAPAAPAEPCRPPIRDDLSALLAEAHDELRRRDDELAAELYELQRLMAPEAAEPAPALAYPRLVARVRALAREAVPAGARVLVISRGDEQLLDLDGATGAHFPAQPDGSYAGSYPADSEAAIGLLEEQRRAGASFLLVPATALWWLEHYRGLRRHLERTASEVARESETAVLFELGGHG